MSEVTVGSARTRGNFLPPIPRARFAALASTTDGRRTLSVSGEPEDSVELVRWDTRTSVRSVRGDAHLVCVGPRGRSDLCKRQLYESHGSEVLNDEAPSVRRGLRRRIGQCVAGASAVVVRLGSVAATVAMARVAIAEMIAGSGPDVTAMRAPLAATITAAA